MDEKKSAIIPIAKFAEEFPGVNLRELRRSLRKFDALIKIGSIEFANPDLYMVNVAEAAEKARVGATKPKRGIGSTDSIGLLRAFIKKSPGIIESKNAAIAAAEERMKTAANNYERRRSSKQLKSLKEGLAEHLIKVEAARKRLDQLLNEEDEPSTTDV